VFWVDIEGTGFFFTSDMALRNQPYLPLYVQDFMTDEKLIECSPGATGIYIKILCVLHKSEKYGTILLQQKDKQTEYPLKNFALKLAKYLPWDPQTIETGLKELTEQNVVQIEGDQLSQKRMVKDNALSETRSEAGKAGGFHKHLAIAKPEAKPLANTESESEDEIESDLLKKVPFEKFWEIYDKKIDRKKCEPKWNRLTKQEQENCIAKMPIYIDSTPDKKYRRDPETYLNNKSWENEVIRSGNQPAPRPLSAAEKLIKTSQNGNI
jgi:hypothetical protein